MSDITSGISAELRELCLSVLLSTPDSCEPKVRKQKANDTIASLSRDKSVPCSNLAAAEGAHSTSSKAPERVGEAPAISRRKPSELQTWRFRRVQTYIGDHIADTIRLADLARAAGLTRMYFAAQFRQKTGVRPHEYIVRQRIARAQVLLMVPQTKIIEVGVCVGFTSQAHFTTVFRRYVGITPHRWRLSQTPEGSPRPANIHSTRTDAQSSQPHNTTRQAAILR